MTQLLHELTGDLARNEAKTDRLILDVAGLAQTTTRLEKTMTWAKAFVFALCFVIPLFCGILWWFIGDDLNRLRDSILQAHHLQ